MLGDLTQVTFLRVLIQDGKVVVFNSLLKRNGTAGAYCNDVNSGSGFLVRGRFFLKQIVDNRAGAESLCFATNILCARYFDVAQIVQQLVPSIS